MKNQNLLLCEKRDRIFYGREKQTRSHFHFPQCDRINTIQENAIMDTNLS
ncbi:MULTISPECIES: hypothetical protein [Spirulina sp. CCY15215]|nr:hypothetical protein [Spirulina major]